MTLCVQMADRLHLALFDDQGLRDHSVSDLTDAITQSCLLPLEAAQVVDAKRLAADLPKLDGRCRQMLAGLGLD